MSFARFVILTSLSGLIALCLLLQIVFARLTLADEVRVSRTEQALQEGETFQTRLVQIANRVAQLAQQQQDQSLKDLLTRQGFQIKQPAAASTAPASSAPEAPAPR
jgi:hypothetical protein